MKFTEAPGMVTTIRPEGRPPPFRAPLPERRGNRQGPTEAPGGPPAMADPHRTSSPRRSEGSPCFIGDLSGNRRKHGRRARQGLPCKGDVAMDPHRPAPRPGTISVLGTGSGRAISPFLLRPNAPRISAAPISGACFRATRTTTPAFSPLDGELWFPVGLRAITAFTPMAGMPGRFATLQDLYVDRRGIAAGASAGRSSSARGGRPGGAGDLIQGEGKK